jgi:hypothetical protein
MKRLEPITGRAFGRFGCSRRRVIAAGVFGCAQAFSAATLALRCTRASASSAAAAGPAVVGGFLSPEGQAATGAEGNPELELRDVVKRARAAGLGDFRVTRSQHFLAVGDAPDAFRKEALERVCEPLGKAFLDHFRARGFALEYPEHALVVIILKDSGSYSRFLGQERDDAVGGHYDLDTNRLVTFDFRPQGGGQGSTRLNLFALVHETAHQLAHNTGLLARTGVIPLAISEGLATYVEPWRPGAGVRTGIGAVNRPRLRAIADAGTTDQPWIPIERLVLDDRVFLDRQTEQLAYGESWLLAHHHLKQRSRLEPFRELLAALNEAAEKVDRVAVFDRTLGDLDLLDRRLKAEARQYLTG